MRNLLLVMFVGLLVGATLVEKADVVWQRYGAWKTTAKLFHAIDATTETLTVKSQLKTLWVDAVASNPNDVRAAYSGLPAAAKSVLTPIFPAVISAVAAEVRDEKTANALAEYDEITTGL